VAAIKIDFNSASDFGFPFNFTAVNSSNSADLHYSHCTNSYCSADSNSSSDVDHCTAAIVARIDSAAGIGFADHIGFAVVADSLALSFFHSSCLTF